MGSRPWHWGVRSAWTRKYAGKILGGKGGPGVGSRGGVWIFLFGIFVWGVGSGFTGGCGIYVCWLCNVFVFCFHPAEPQQTMMPACLDRLATCSEHFCGFKCVDLA